VKRFAEIQQLATVLRGVPVWGTLPDSAGEHAGLRFGDVILAIDGTRVETLDAYVRARSAAHETMRVTIFRDGEELELEVAVDRQRAVDFAKLARDLVDQRLVPTERPPKPTGES
jgi:S1-C subfamily serine protease